MDSWHICSCLLDISNRDVEATILYCILQKYYFINSLITFKKFSNEASDLCHQISNLFGIKRQVILISWQH